HKVHDAETIKINTMMFNTHSTDSDTGQLLILTDDDDPNTLNSKKVNPTNRKRTRATRELTSFVWNYFKREEDLTSATCYVIKEDGIECGHYYNDGSTTSNLIHHLATKHKIFKPGSTEEAKYLKETQSQSDIRVAIKKRKTKIEIEVVDLTSNTGRNKKKINIFEPMETMNIIPKIQKILYNSMFNYWKNINKVGMLACLLDPHFKKLRFVKQRIRDQVIDELKDLYEDARLDYHQNPITNTNH
ncbi:4927_t:CDS:2, partial [Funneliformis geosporum]